LFQPLDIELLHPQHRLQDFLGPPGIWIGHHLAQDSGDDLPRQSVFILQPAALYRFATLGELLPHPVHFLLRVAVHDERDGLGELELRPTVECEELLPVELELHGQYATFGLRSTLATMSDLADLGVLED